MIPYSTQLIEDDDLEAVIQALKSTNLTQGKKVEEFEEALCNYLGVNFVIVLNSATSALYATYKAFNLTEKNEAITTPISFAATSNMLLVAGIKPIFCDIKDDGNIDESKIESLITQDTKAIIPVDFGGNPVEIDKIIEIAKRYNLIVIRDASHALGSQENNLKVGQKADATIFSFHAIKPITTAEGGAVATNNKEIADKIRLIRSHGIVKKVLWNSDMIEMGFNFRLSDINCALGISQLKKLDRFIKKREEIANFYDNYFDSNPYFRTIPIAKNKKSSRHLYPILLNQHLWCQKEEIFNELLNLGIGVQVHYKPIYQFSYYKRVLKEQYLDKAESFYKSEISIPCNQKMNLKDAEFVAKSVIEVCKKYDKKCGL